MTDKSLEEQATELLEEFARENGLILRDLGIINRHRARKINEHETPMSAVWPNLIPAKAKDSDDQLEEE